MVEVGLGSILVVDDDPDNGQVMSEYLSSIGYHVETVCDGVEAIKRLKQASFDLVITDLNMPRFNGLELLETIKDAGLAEDVLIVSATHSVPTAVQAMRAGAFTYLEKPIVVEQLRTEVRSAIRARRQRLSGSAPPPPPRATTPPLPAEVAPALTALIRPSLGSADTTMRAARAPAMIGRYKVDRVLGSGGMGTVYECTDDALGRRCAVKVLSLDHLSPDQGEMMRERFTREARAAGQLSHPNIVTVYDFGEARGLELLFLAMQLSPGTSLAKRLETGGRLPWTRVVAIAFQIADALAYAHQRGVVHRDVKHANIMVTEDDFTQILDFGIAKLRDSTLTLPGALVGSPGYLAPESLGDGNTDYRADQFSLGTVMLEALAGVRLYSGEDFRVVVHRILAEPAPTFQTLGISAPPELERLIGRLQEKDPDRRFTHEVALLDELATIGRLAGLDLRRHRPVPT